VLLEKLARVRARISEAARRSGRSPESVELVAVTKYADSGAILELLKSGQVRHIGESRVQDAEKKLSALSSQLSALGAKAPAWHLVGHLQANKARKAARMFDWIESVDSLEIAEKLDRAAADSGRRLQVLIQVQPLPNPRQHGVQPAAVGDLIAGMGRLEHLDLRGLMAIGPMLEPVQAVRPHFRIMRQLFERFFSSPQREDRPYHLSMGMSRDFEIAVEEGATMVRIGSLLFDESS